MRQYWRLCESVLIAKQREESAPCQRVRSAQSIRTDKQALVQASKGKRDAEGLRARALSEKIGVSLSSLPRILCGKGEPDNHSTIQILQWLGPDAGDRSLQITGVALVHFQAVKTLSTEIVEFLLKAANSMRMGDKFDPQNSDLGLAVSLSKPEME